MTISRLSCSTIAIRRVQPSGLYVLASFARQHPEVDLSVTAGLSYTLYDAFDRASSTSSSSSGATATGVARPTGESALPGCPGRICIGGHGAPLPLRLYPPPSVTRALTIETLRVHSGPGASRSRVRA